MAKLSVELQRYFFEEERSSDVKLQDILTLAGERVFGFLFILLALPAAIPLPAMGYSVPFGIAMLLLAFQLITGAKTPWLPLKMLRASMKLKTIQSFLKKGLPWLRRIEALSKPRMTHICTSLLGKVIIGIAISLMSISMMIPIPGTNTLPAMGIFITAFGLQEDDGFISLAGLVVCLIGGIVSVVILWSGVSLLDMAVDWLKLQLN
ncbi:MAG: exopolysaccharide biosynthesis protein [Microcystaceae cyanobacterium]